MRKYDISEITSRINLEDILDQYGWETKRSGRYILVLCKFHHDTKFGSAVIFPNDPNSFYCFTCGRKYTIFDIYMYENNCSFSDALKALAKDCGIESREDGSNKELMPFSREELKIIGLCMETSKSDWYPEAYVCCDEDVLKKPGYRIEKECYYSNPDDVHSLKYEYTYMIKKGDSAMMHMNELFRDDKEAFKLLVYRKAVEAEKNYLDNYMFLQAVSAALKEWGITSNLTKVLAELAHDDIKKIRKILYKLKRL